MTGRMDHALKAEAQLTALLRPGKDANLLLVFKPPPPISNREIIRSSQRRVVGLSGSKICNHL